MNEVNEVDGVVMLPCPFCGHKCDLNEPDTLYQNGIYWRDSEDIGRAYFGHTHRLFDPFTMKQCWQISCVTVSGGCGAQIIGDSKHDAIAMWQRRAT